MTPTRPLPPDARDADNPALPRNYRMSERALHDDFGIRSQDTALPNPAPHRHEYFQIHVQLEQATRHFLGGSSRPVEPGTLCFVLPFKTHFIPTVPGSRYYIINASLGYLLPALDIDMLDLEHMPIERAPELAPFRFQEDLDFVLDADNLAIARHLCEAMAHEDTRRSWGSTIMIRGYLLQLLALVWRQYGEPLAQHASAPNATLGRHPAFSRLLAYLRVHLHQPVSLSDAAAAVHLSPTYLAHLVKRETGKTFVELLTARRIAHARALLLHTNLSVKEIAFQAGFTDAAYFGRRFRQLEGHSPLAARTRLQRPDAI